MKIDLALGKTVRSAEFDVRASDFKTEIGKIDGAAGHAKFSGESGNHIFNIGILGTPLAFAAE